VSKGATKGRKDIIMHSREFQIRNEEETVRFGRTLAKYLEAGDVIGLCGDLGAGKTFLAGAIARGLGVPDDEPVTSPTFTLINEYLGKIPIYHMDLYRLGEPGELYDLGLWEYYDSDGVCIVEWCDRYDDLWPDHALVLTIEFDSGDARFIRAIGKKRGAKLLEDFAAMWGE